MPDGVTVTVVKRKVNVSGPRGKLFLDLSHLPIDLKVTDGGKTVSVERWFTSGKQAASIHTAISHVSNMFTGVTKVRARRTCYAPRSPSSPSSPSWPCAPRPAHSCFARGLQGFKYKMRFVYAHFLINVAITKKDTRVEIRNFLGEKVVRIVDAQPGVIVKRSTDIKDEIVLEGNDIQAVSRTCALIQQICAVKRKDIRKFLDGIYVSGKGTCVVD